MSRPQALYELPTSHAVALRLQDAGASDELIAQALGVEVGAVPSLILVAERKLAMLFNAAERAP